MAAVVGQFVVGLNVTTNGINVAAGGITVVGNSSIAGTLSGITTLTATTLAGTLSTAAQPNVTSLGTLTSLTTSGGATVGNGLTVSAGGLAVTGPVDLGGNVNAVLKTGTSVLNINDSGNTRNVAIFTGAGGFQIGNPTNGDLGSGWINVASGIKLNGTAYVNPDYVLERWATGRIVRYADKPGAITYQALTLPQMEAYARTNWALPGFGQQADNDLFSGSDQLLARVEDGYRYLFDHEHRLAVLEAKLRR